MTGLGPCCTFLKDLKPSLHIFFLKQCPLKTLSSNDFNFLKFIENLKVISYIPDCSNLMESEDITFFSHVKYSMPLFSSAKSSN